MTAIYALMLLCASRAAGTARDRSNLTWKGGGIVGSIAQLMNELCLSVILHVVIKKTVDLIIKKVHMH